MPQLIERGLCLTCVHARRVATRRGSVFLMCQAAEDDQRLRQYPQLPVRECHAFREERPTETPAADPR